MGVGDKLLVMRDSPGTIGNLNGVTETSGTTANTTRIDTGALAIGIGGGSLIKPMILAVIVPTAPTSLVVKLQHSDDDTTYEDLANVPEQAWAGGYTGTGVSGTPLQITAVGEYRVHFISR